MSTANKISLRQDYDQHGFVIARNVIDAGLAVEMVDHIAWLSEKYPDVRPEMYHHNMLVHDPFIHRLVGDNRLLDIAEQFIGSDIALFAAHYIAKDPKKGRAVDWHQDGSYWPLKPMEVTTLWVAGTPSSVENGCMRVLPGTQNNKLFKRSEMVDVDRKKYVLEKGIHPNQIDESTAVDIELGAGDVSIHNPVIIHGSNANLSDQWRVGLTLRYIPTSTRVLKEDHMNILLRGKADVENIYAERPSYIAGEHMPFTGCEAWV